MTPVGETKVPAPVMALLSWLNWSAAHPAKVAFTDPARRRKPTMADPEHLGIVHREELEVAGGGRASDEENVVGHSLDVLVEVLMEAEDTECSRRGCEGEDRCHRGARGRDGANGGPVDGVAVRSVKDPELVASSSPERKG